LANYSLVSLRVNFDGGVKDTSEFGYGAVGHGPLFPTTRMHDLDGQLWTSVACSPSATLRRVAMTR
jgi:hypothetical protein